MMATFDPPRALAFTWSWEHEPARPVREVRIDVVGSGCAIGLVHGTYTTSNEDRDERQGHVDGWRHLLERLHGVVARGPAA